MRLTAVPGCGTMAQANASLFGADVEVPGMLEAVVAQVARDNELILVSSDASAYAAPTALNTVLQLRSLGLDNVLLLSDSSSSCRRLRDHGMPSLSCVWSSRIPTTRPQHDGLCVSLYWDMRCAPGEPQTLDSQH